MVGAALVRRLSSESCTILTVDHAALDLTRHAKTEQWIGTAKPGAVILAAARPATQYTARPPEILKTASKTIPKVMWANRCF